ncbi:MAG TPA: hypothetical protein QF564_24565 [Pirellulaceae bacterium]|nr:hypothetical protein [Pirellulaceae bacterium]
MLHPLKKQVRAVRRRAHRMVLVHGLGWWSALALIAAFLVGLADYLFRFQDDGARALVFVAVVSFLSVTFWRIVLPGLRRRTSDLQVAQLIEQRFPQLQDRLSSSLAFLGEPSGKAAMGSPALQESVIAETDRLVSTLNIFDCLEGNAARRAVGVAMFVAATTCALCALDLPAARIASHRLLLPWSDAAWPRRNQLEFVDPPRLLARGSDFEVALIDRNRHLPATATLQIKFAEDGKLHSRNIRSVNGQIVARLDNVTRAFRFRASGGDDHTMAWHDVEVRNPVQISNVVISVQAPDYTGLPSRNSDRLIRMWAGSELRLKADLSAPADIVTIDSSFAGAPETQLASDGRSLQIPPVASAPWVPTESGTFRFRIRDHSGLEVTSDLSFDLTIVQDAPPTVTLELPMENESFMSSAEVPMHVIMRDDLAVRSASLIYQDQSWPVFGSPADRGPSQPRMSLHDGDRHVIDTVWKLNPLQLQPGDIVEFQVVAKDDKPQTGDSGIRHLTIISANDFDNRMNRDQAEIRRRIEKALKLQLDVQSHTDILVESTDWSVATSDSESLQAAHWRQQQVRQFVSGTDGALPLAKKLLQRLANNHANKPDVADRLQSVIQKLLELDAIALPNIEHQLGSAFKNAQTRGLDPTTKERLQSQAAVRSARQDQQHVVEVLETLLHRFAKWSDARRIATDVANMQQQQQELIHDTNAVNTVGKTRDGLTAEEAELLRQLVQRQAQLARRADRLLLELEQLHQQVAAENPAFAAMLRRAFEAAKRTDVAATAHEARRNLEENQIGSASSRQNEVRAGLQDIADAISRRSPDPTTTLLASVKGWLVRQQSLVTATIELGSQGADQLTTSERQRRARNVAVRQEDLAGEISGASQLQYGPVVRFILSDASRLMRNAARELARTETGQTAQKPQQAAQTQLIRLTDALRSESQKTAESTASNGDSTGQQPEAQTAEQRIGIADLQLLRQLQLEINQQTTEIERERDDKGVLSGQHQVELAKIEGRQQRLADLVFSLLGDQPAETAPSQPNVGADLDDALRKANIPGFDINSARPQDGIERSSAAVQGEDVGTNSVHLLQQIRAIMVDVQVRLHGRDTSQETLTMQQSIIEGLSKMIDEQLKSASQQSATGGQVQRPGPATGDRPRATNGTGTALSSEGGTDNMDLVFQRIWGHLPDQVRQQIETPLHEKFLPPYDDVIQNYFKRLANENPK